MQKTKLPVKENVVNESEAVEKPKSNKGLTCLIVGCAVILFLVLLIVAGIVYAAYKIKSQPELVSTFMGSPQVQKLLQITPAVSDMSDSPLNAIVEELSDINEQPFEENKSTMGKPSTDAMMDSVDTADASIVDMDGSYMIPYSQNVRLTRSDLTAFSFWELKIARNEIYARHGRPFVSKDMSCYFAKQPWYTLDNTYTDARLSALELENAVIILNYEKSVGSNIYSTDTGCR